MIQVPVLQLLSHSLFLILLGGEALRAVVAMPMVVLGGREIVRHELLGSSSEVPEAC